MTKINNKDLGKILKYNVIMEVLIYYVILSTNPILFIQVSESHAWSQLEGASQFCK